MPAFEIRPEILRVIDMGRSDKRQLCPTCGTRQPTRGFANHARACEKRQIAHHDFTQYALIDPIDTSNPELSEHRPPRMRPVSPNEFAASDISIGTVESPDDHQSDSPQSSFVAEDKERMLDDIKTVYHPHSSLASHVQRFQDYGTSQSHEDPSIPTEPWRPFRTRLDFEIAELALATYMNEDEVNTLCSLVHRAASGLEKFTVEGQKDLDALWELAADKRTKWITKDTKLEFPFSCRDLWEWAMDLVKDPMLAPHFHWDAEQLYKYDGKDFVRFIHEPWTAERFWRVQSALPPNARPLPFIIYADKNKLSSFGTQKGYPVVARLANLDAYVRNGVGTGGGCVVGWLPIVAEDAEETHKTGFVDMKNVVWHECFKILLHRLEEYSRTGHHTVCGDLLDRWLFPFILILSADYEEMCVMTLIRGVNSLCPCPRCLVPKERLFDLSVKHTLRTTEHTMRLHKQAANLRKKGERGELYKAHGLRPVENSFMRLANSCPYDAASSDDLHMDDSGLGGAHLVSQLKAHVAAQGRLAEAALDSRFKATPPWRELNHFDSVMNISFNDGGKHRDIAKIFLFSAVGILTPEDQAGYTLLQAQRGYLNMTMYSGLSVHTNKTIQAGRDDVKKFDRLMKVYMKLTEGTQFEKNWNFPKMHLHLHVFDDIVEKGVIRNMSTKPSEKMHGPLRKIYLNRTNFKNVADQILNVNHNLYIALHIRELLDCLDDRSKRLKQEVPKGADGTRGAEQIQGQFHLGSKQKPISFQQLEANTAHHFTRFRSRLSEFLTGLLNLTVRFQPHDTITPYCFYKPNYESTVTWRLITDYLRANPLFHSQPRYDFVLVAAQKPFFGQLLYVFSCRVNETDYHIALIQPYEVLERRSRPLVDKQLGLLRVHRADSRKTEFISLRSVIRGALVVTAELDAPNDRFVVDVVDEDMFLRVKELFPGYTATPEPVF